MEKDVKDGKEEKACDYISRKNCEFTNICAKKDCKHIVFQNPEKKSFIQYTKGDDNANT